MNAKRKEIAPYARPVTEAELAIFAQRTLPLGFRASLLNPHRLTIIAEVKRASPSVGDIAHVVQDQALRPKPLPCIRKDFMVHPYQVLEAAQAGARCILIIVRGLTDDEIRPLHHAAQIAGLDVLFEVHDEAELERALKHNPTMVGVNNRNLSTFQIDLSFAERVLPQMPGHILKVAESGIKTVDDARRMRQAGAQALLVGESLMRSPNPQALLSAFRGV
ncbi:MAG: indole-3-glycerol-phosphate synthase [Verrucomicrobia bacterium]|nr:indole-3-glycerol-phosphate synthase [Verrucomicrobiota bacterium]